MLLQKKTYNLQYITIKKRQQAPLAFALCFCFDKFCCFSGFFSRFCSALFTELIRSSDFLWYSLVVLLLPLRLAFYCAEHNPAWIIGQRVHHEHCMFKIILILSNYKKHSNLSWKLSTSYGCASVDFSQHESKHSTSTTTMWILNSTHATSSVDCWGDIHQRSWNS
jgi:hypothetical protein